MSSSQTTRNNHYVPIWYQKQFISGGAGRYLYLDLHPEEQSLPNGKTFLPKNPRNRPPKKCFVELDLYTTRFGPIRNDDVEKYLFGRIDNEGAKALRAFVESDQQGMHQNFQTFFEYMDAQKLRTPKGLDWLHHAYGGLSQLDLMLELQYVRQMHCTMWFEAVREIVSAENSDVKFIVSDHPIVSYNAACPPDSKFCQYPNDPTIEFVGTQTVFPLSADYCLVLSNLEYAQQGGDADHLALRQNARRLGRTIARTDKMIRVRELDSGQVAKINRIIKDRSRQFIAAPQESWLHPEQVATDSWSDLGDVLIPPKDELWSFGGETYFGFKDGTSGYQDAFGRTDPRHEFLQKEPPKEQPSANDFCPCGSGRKFKRCCINVDKADCPPWSVFSIRERNLMFCNAVTNILGLNDERTWDDVRRELTDEEVVKIHESYEMLWPPDTNFADLLPRPDSKTVRAVYMGLIDPRTIGFSVLSNLAYVDEIVIPNPFPHPGFIRPEYSPTKTPAQHKSGLLKNVLTLLTLEPFIYAGLVHLVPDPMDVSDDYRRVVMPMLEGRREGLSVSKDDLKHQMALGEEDAKRQMLRLPEDVLREQILRSQPDISPELLEDTLKYMKKQLEKDPLALLQPLGSGEGEGELMMVRGISMETALFFASLTGSVMLTDEPSSWKILHDGATKGEGFKPGLSQPAESMSDLSFPVDANPEVTLELRHFRHLSYVRRAIRRIVSQANDPSLEASPKVAERLERANQRAQAEWAACDSKIAPTFRLSRKFQLSGPEGGFVTNEVRRLLVFFGRHYENPSCNLAMLAINGPENTKPGE